MECRLHFLFAFAAMCVSGVFPLPAFAVAEATGWTEYVDAKYGLRAIYPADLFGNNELDADGSSIEFKSTVEGAKLRIGLKTNESGYTPTTYADFVTKHASDDGFKISYRRIASSWLALSGEGRGLVFYQKMMFSCEGRLLSGFALLYPIEQKDMFDAVVERMEKSFRPGTACKAVSAPARPEPSNTAVPTRTTPPTIRNVQRENRRATTIVIMRRTSPPYDYRVIRIPR